MNRLRVRLRGAAVGGARPLLFLAAGWTAVAGCERPEPALDPPVTFDTAAARIETASDTFHLTVEVAERPEQRSQGLMERDALEEDHGMIFLHDDVRPDDAGFWMFRTRIPLDIAFLDEDGRIVAIRAMQPCPSPNPRVCPHYPPGVPYRSALEVKRGYFEARGIGLGDRVVLLGSD